MARPKTFDPSVALEQAMEVFWLKGYEATSMQDLVVAMGINRASLYATFEDKRQLFLAAIAHYDDTVVRPAIAPLEAPGAAKAEIVQHFQRSTTAGLRPPARLSDDQCDRGMCSPRPGVGDAAAPPAANRRGRVLCGPGAG
jgi:AcrR family transcriptional regulator